MSENSEPEIALRTILVFCDALIRLCKKGGTIKMKPEIADLLQIKEWAERGLCIESESKNVEKHGEMQD